MASSDVTDALSSTPSPPQNQAVNVGPSPSELNRDVGSDAAIIRDLPSTSIPDKEFSDVWTPPSSSSSMKLLHQVSD